MVGFWKILKADSTRFANGLPVACETESRTTPRCVAKPFIEIGEIVGGAGFRMR